MILILFPHQLFEAILSDSSVRRVILHEHPLYLTKFPFHSAKLMLHRDSMSGFSSAIEHAGKRAEIRAETLVVLAEELRAQGVTEIAYFELSDDWLEEDVKRAFDGFQRTILPSPMFLTPNTDLNAYFKGKKRVFMADFYKWQRRRLNLLLDDRGDPIGGRWSFDEDNRKPIHKSVQPPARTRDYPVTHAEARKHLTTFLESCLDDFGPYEDAMRASDGRLFHSVLTPALNIGLLTPQEVVEATLAFAEEHPVQLASLEGFLRQLVGWREFVHGTYQVFGRRQRTTNFFGFTNSLPEAFWKAETGLTPADTVIRRVNESGYCHHIERLMVLGCLLLLLEIRPNDVYGWFMTQFIDAYDWVMVPNVYGMSQYADGGLMTSKPYLCGSAYLRKMGDWPKGDWCADWDALYWRFIHRHRKMFLSNHRSSMMVALYDKLKPETKVTQLARIRELEQRLSLSLPTDPLQ